MIYDGFPTYQQLDKMDCGATCLRMIARHYGRYYSLEHLRELSHVGRQGVTLLGISDAAESIGMQTLAVETTFEQLSSVIPMPCIVHWENEHFVVVYRIYKNRVWIADPAKGRYQLDKDEFLRHWISESEEEESHGIVLLMQTTPEFYSRDGEKQNKGGIAYIAKYFRNYSNLVIQLCVGLFLGMLLQLIFPFLIRGVVDVGIGNRNLNFITLVLVAQGVLFLTQVIVEYIRTFILLHVGVRVNISLISDYLIKLTRLPIRFFDSRVTGDLLQRISDHERVQRFLSSTTLLSAFSFFNLLAFGIILASWNLRVFLVFLVGTFINFLWVSWFMQKRRELDYRHFAQSSENQVNLMEMVNGMQEIKLYNAEKQKRWAWERGQARLFRTNMSELRIEQLQRAGAIAINEGKNLLIIYLIAQAVVKSQMSLGMLVAAQYIIGQLNSQINRVVDFMQSWQEASISMERINEIHLKEDEENPQEKMTILPETGDIVIDNLSFHYEGPSSPMVLKGIELRIPKGKTTAIVGRSGSGKTTLLKLLLNFYDPTEGTIRVGDVLMRNLSNRIWREKCGVVMQEGYIFNDTIARNVALGDEIIDKEKLLRAVKVANIQSFIEALPMGYNTKIGSEGLGLSQGQKQRLYIARAVYKNPDYLFFDEATTALDVFNEMVIMENLNEYFRRKTIIIVAHRLSTVMNADNIIVLEDGEIVEQGTHAELTYMRGAYYQLVKNQLELGS
ncbi:peptidase domain-containing ABC transporter [Haliscomenobacter sp.]|uniref:peptidase domain-containing ABC transporter n=1 Tax=Haliscomenobacter sp. TaxID=2717303 RepID=UPI003364E881